MYMILMPQSPELNWIPEIALPATSFSVSTHRALSTVRGLYNKYGTARSSHAPWLQYFTLQYKYTCLTVWWCRPSNFAIELDILPHEDSTLRNPQKQQLPMIASHSPDRVLIFAEMSQSADLIPRRSSITPMPHSAHTIREALKYTSNMSQCKHHWLSLAWLGLVGSTWPSTTCCLLFSQYST
jgi:hypothetical protein